MGTTVRSSSGPLPYYILTVHGIVYILNVIVYCVWSYLVYKEIRNCDFRIYWLFSRAGSVGSRDAMSVCPPLWFKLKFLNNYWINCTDMHGPQRVVATEFGEPPTFFFLHHNGGWYLWVLGQYPKELWDCRVSLVFRHPCLPQGELQ